MILDCSSVIILKENTLGGGEKQSQVFRNTASLLQESM